MCEYGAGFRIIGLTNPIPTRRTHPPCGSVIGLKAPRGGPYLDRTRSPVDYRRGRGDRWRPGGDRKVPPGSRLPFTLAEKALHQEWQTSSAANPTDTDLARKGRLFTGVLAFLLVANATTTLAQPAITRQPEDQFLSPGQTASFRVTASPQPVAYQWHLDGRPIPSGTNAVLSLPNAQPSQSGDYFLVASNASGTAISRMARLKVFVPAPHAFAGIARKPHGTVSLAVVGETLPVFGQFFDLFPIEASFDLVNWTPLKPLVGVNRRLEPLDAHDPFPTNARQQFYRLSTNHFVTPFPEPTGPYRVGTISRLFTDPSRTNRTRGTNHQFMVTFWYPAAAQAGASPARYLETRLALNSDRWGPRTDRVISFHSHSISNAPLAPDSAVYPLVLYSHGGTGHRRDNTDKAEDLASWGYIVVGFDHRTTPLSVFPDGRVVSGGFGPVTVAEFRVLVDEWVLDARFVLDELTRLHLDDPFFAGRFDLERIGAFGFSFGGAMAAELCRVDSRCKATAGLDGIFWKPDLLLMPLNKPFLFFRSDDGPDPDPTFIENGVLYDDRKKIYETMTTNAYWIRVTNTVHQSFGERALIWDPASFQSEWVVPARFRATPGVRVSEIVRAYLRSFFGKHLLGRDDPLLDGPSPDVPEVKEFLRK